MEWIFQWVKNITYYLVLISLVSNLLPDTRYERYIKLFCGVVFILLVMSPLTAGLKLDQMLAQVYGELCVARDTADFEDRLWGIEAEQVERIFAQYEEAVSQDVRGMAEEAGFSCLQARAQIEKREGEEHFGQVVAVELVLEREGQDGQGADRAGAGDDADGAEESRTDEDRDREAQKGDESRTVGSIKVQVELGAIGVDSGQAPSGPAPGDGKGQGDREGQGDGKGQKDSKEQERGRGQEALYGFQRKVAEYYGLEEKAVRITWKDD